MSRIRGFPPVSQADARILILGSMPSLESLRLQQYYAHPRNAFWPIMRRLFDSRAREWGDKAQLLQKKGIALWDVLQACTREGSLDSAIDERSIVVNNFPGLFDSHPEIRHVYFNGAKAESIYRRHVLPLLKPDLAKLPQTRLPSTSPAHASLDLEQKAAAWAVILDSLR